MSGKVEFSIIIVTYNSAKTIGKCLNSIEEFTKTENYEIIVYDNNSDDDTVSVLKNINFPRMRIICGEENLGFGKACNKAVLLAKGKNIFFVNPDLYLTGVFFDDLNNYLNTNEEIGVVGGILKYPDGSLQKSAYKFHTFWNRLGVLLNIERFLPRKPLTEFLFIDLTADFEKPREVDWVLGAALGIRRELFERIGRFNEDYFMYMEDTEVCFQVKRSGYKVMQLPAVAYHHFGASAVSNLAITIPAGQKSCNIFFKKHYSMPEYLSINIAQRLVSLIKLILLIPVSVCKRDREHISRIKGYFKAIFVR